MTESHDAAPGSSAPGSSGATAAAGEPSTRERLKHAFSDMPAAQALDHTRLPDDDPRLPQGPSAVASADAMGATAIAYLVTGPMLFGGIGWALDHWLGWGLAPLVGILVGMALSVYLIWFRYGSS